MISHGFQYGGHPTIVRDHGMVMKKGRREGEIEEEGGLEG